MTWITDSNGTRWVEPVKRKERKPPRALRFADVKVGDQIMHAVESKRIVNGVEVPYMRGVHYYVVTDLWDDPVEGQSDPLKGKMVGYAQIDDRGEVSNRKSKTTIRGLA